MDVIDPYEELELEHGASPADAKRAYHRLAWELHPDRNGDDPVAAERLRRASAAYDRILRPPPEPEFVVVSYQPPAPRRMVSARTLVIGGALACVATFGLGAAAARHGAADVDAARRSGAHAGERAGTRAAVRRDYRQGYVAGRRDAYEQVRVSTPFVLPEDPWAAP